jgi:signal transduction histidine kinase
MAHRTYLLGAMNACTTIHNRQNLVPNYAAHLDDLLPVLHRLKVLRAVLQPFGHLRFLLDFPEHFPILDADSDRIAQVLRNLLDNAVKYSPQGGLVIARGEAHEDEVVCLGCCALGRSMSMMLPDDEVIVVIAIEVEDALTFGEECTPAVAAAIPGAVEAVLAEIADLKSCQQMEGDV